MIFHGKCFDPTFFFHGNCLAVQWGGVGNHEGNCMETPCYPMESDGIHEVKRLKSDDSWDFKAQILPNPMESDWFHEVLPIKSFQIQWNVMDSIRFWWRLKSNQIQFHEALPIKILSNTMESYGYHEIMTVKSYQIQWASDGFHGAQPAWEMIQPWVAISRIRAISIEPWSWWASSPGSHPLASVWSCWWASSSIDISGNMSPLLH